MSGHTLIALQTILCTQRAAVCGLLWTAHQHGKSCMLSACHSPEADSAQVSNMLLPSEATRQEVKVSDAMLLSLYEAVNLNRHFITVLTQVCTLQDLNHMHTHKPCLPPEVDSSPDSGPRSTGGLSYLGLQSGLVALTRSLFQNQF